MNNNTITIQLREEDATYNARNGDYTVNLPDPIPIYPNDMTEIKSCYIDSIEANQGDIILPEDVEVGVDFVNYFQNNSITAPSTKTYRGGNANQPDLEEYIACRKAIIPDMANAYAIGEMKVYRESPSVNGGKWGRQLGEPPLILKFQFQDPSNIAGDKIVRQVPIPFQDGSSDSLIINNNTKTNGDPNAPGIFPFFIGGQIADITNPTNPAVVLLNPEDIRADDNLDIASIQANNRQGVGRGRDVWFNIYAGSDFKRITQFQFRRQSGPAQPNFGNGAKITVQVKDWRTGLLATPTFEINQSFNNTPATFTLLNEIQCVAGAVGVNRPLTDSTGTVKYIEPQTFPDDCPLNEDPPNIATKDENDDSNFFMEGFTIVAGSLDFTASFLINTQSFTIPAGSYPLSQLCEILTDNFSSLEGNPPNNVFNNFPSNNSFLMTNDQIRARNNLSNTDLQFYARADGGEFATLGPSGAGVDPFIGTSQTAFISDVDINKTKIDNIHQSLYATGSLTQVAQWLNRGAGGQKLIGRNGGIIFTDMRPKEFWEQLGFSYAENERIFESPSQIHTVIGGVGFLTQSIPTTIGRFTTTADTGLDSALLKTNPTFFSGFAPLNASGGGTITTNKAIIAPNTVAESAENDGYFMVEVNGMPTTMTIGSSFQSNKVQSIISRYYQSGSYTTSYNEGSTPVVYQGEPYLLSSFNVRILSSDGTVSNDVNNKSSVFIQITRNSNIE